MISRLLTGLMAAAFVGLFVFAPASAFAGTAADAMNKLKEQSSDIKAESSSASGKADEASADADRKAKAKKAAKELLEKGKKRMGN